LWFNGICDGINTTQYWEQQQRYMSSGAKLPGPGSSSVFVCPSVSEGFGTLNPVDAAGGIKNQDGYCWLQMAPPGVPFGAQQRPTFFCYVLNSKLNTTPGHESQKISQLRPASAVVVFVEKRIQPGEIPTSDPFYSKALGQLRADHNRMAGRHRNGGFLGFADGHVAWSSFKDVNTLQNKVGDPLDYNQPGRVVWNPFGNSEDGGPPVP
jgi:hypothetical protein